MLRYIWSHITQWRIRNNSTKLKHLILSNNEPNPIRLVEATTNNTFIQTFQIKYHLKNFTQSLWKAFTHVISQNKTIQSLDFSSAGLGDEGIQKLAPLLKENQSLRKLDLSKNNITPAGAVALADILTGSNKLKELLLSENPLGNGFNTIFQTLENNAQLTSLVISDQWKPNGLDDTHVDALVKMIALNQNLKQLDLTGNQFSDTGIRKLLCQLALNDTLHTANIDSTTIGDEGWLALGEWVSKTTSLQSLSIGYEWTNKDAITEQGLTGLLNALQFNTSLKHLSISYKKDNDLLVTNIAALLETNRTLESITIKACVCLCAVTQKGMDALVKALQTNTSVCEINITVKLDSNQVKAETANELERLLARNRLIKAIKENPVALPQLIKNASYTLLDNVFFATLIKSLPEYSLIEHEQLLSNAMKKRYRPLTILKRWSGINQDIPNIQSVLRLLAHQAQASDASSQMALGYIYKNQLFNQALDPTQAKACFTLATTSKDKTIAANAHFEVGHIHFIYTQDLQRATAHFDHASQCPATANQARQLRDHTLSALYNNHTPMLPDENERKAQLNNFHQRQELLSGIKEFFASLNRTLSQEQIKPSFIRKHQTSPQQNKPNDCATDQEKPNRTPCAP